MPRHRKPSLPVTFVPRYKLVYTSIRLDRTTGAEHPVGPTRLIPNPEYGWEEARFALGDLGDQSFRKGLRKEEPSDWSKLLEREKARPERQIAMLEAWRDELGKNHSDAAVLQVVRSFGLKQSPEEHKLELLFRRRSPEEHRVLQLRQELRVAAARRVGEWRRTARLGSAQERIRVRRLLKRVCRAGATTDRATGSAHRSSRLGRPSAASAPRELVAEYGRLLFLSRQIAWLLHHRLLRSRLLRSWSDSPRDWVEMVVRYYRLKDVAKRARFTLAELLERLQVRPDGALKKGQPLPDWAMARLLTARVFRITVQRLENVLAAYLIR